MKIKDLLKISRPRFWMYLAGPYLVGYAFGIQNPTQLLTPFFALNFLYFLIPANFLLYGINDYFDFDTDKFNHKKDEQEHRLKLKEKNLLIGYLLLALALSFFLIAIQTLNEVQLLISLFLFLALFYSAPPFRLKAKPVLDFSSNILYGLPAVVGYYQTTESFPPFLALLAIFCWTSAMHLFSAIPDIQPDKKAHLHTSAVTFGKNVSLIICLVFWTIASTLTIYLFPHYLSLVAIAYPLIPFFLLIDKKSNINKIYWYYPYLNTFIGFLLFLVGILR